MRLPPLLALTALIVHIAVLRHLAVLVMVVNLTRDGSGCTCMLRYLTVPLEPTRVRGRSHALNMVLAENVSQRTHTTPTYTVQGKYSKYKHIQIQIQMQ